MSPQEIEDRTAAREWLRKQGIFPSSVVQSGLHPGVQFVYLGITWDNDAGGDAYAVLKRYGQDHFDDELRQVHYSQLRL